MMMVYGQATRKFCRLSRQMTTKRYFFDDTSSVLCRQRRLLESTLTDRQSSIYQKQCSKRLFGSQSGGGDSVKIVEVGPRDGLQNESLSTNDVVVSVETKVSLIQKLASAGLTTIEVGSFVSPKWVPQMANSGEVVDAVHEWASKENVLSLNFPCLVPNQKGMEQAIQHGIQEIAIFGSASEAFSQKNIGCSIAESIDRFQVVVDMAKEHNVRIRGYLSCVVGCPYQGEVTPQEVGNVIEKLLKLGCYEVSLGDTIGVGTPGSVVPMLDTALQIADESKYAMHCHDTYGQALANIYASLERGIRTFDSSVAGLGGCPYAKGASGNVATEDVVYMVHGMGMDTGVDLEKLVDAGEFICQELKRTTHSKVAKALLAKRTSS